MTRHRARAALNYRTVIEQCVCHRTQSRIGPELRHEEAQRMSQDTGGNPYHMSSQTAPAWPFDIEHRRQGAEDGLHTMADTPDQGLDPVRPLALLVVLAQGQELNPSLAPQALFQSGVVVNLVPISTKSRRSNTWGSGMEAGANSHSSMSWLTVTVVCKRSPNTLPFLLVTTPKNWLPTTLLHRAPRL